MYNKVELCGVNTAELPVLSEQEKRQLLTRARAGDQSARQSMIEGNLRLVRKPGRPVSSGLHRAHQGHRQL